MGDKVSDKAPFSCDLLPDSLEAASVRDRIMLLICLDGVPEKQGTVGRRQIFFDQL